MRLAVEIQMPSFALNTAARSRLAATDKMDFPARSAWRPSPRWRIA